MSLLLSLIQPLMSTTRPLSEEKNYFGKCKHLFEAACDNPLLSGPNGHSWNTWSLWNCPWFFFHKLFAIQFFVVVVRSKLVWHPFCLFWLLFPFLGFTLLFWVTLLLDSPSWHGWWWYSMHFINFINPWHVSKMSPIW